MKQIIFLTILALFFSFSAFAQTEKSPCPEIDVSGGAPVNVGDLVTFTVISDGRIENLNVQYEWKVSSGLIASGQGTPTITIDTANIPSGTSFTVNLRVTGLPENCKNIAEDNGSVMPRILIRDPDEFGKLSANEIKARIEALFVALENEPNLQGYIVNYGTDKEIATREGQIRKAISFRKFETSRITIARGGSNPVGNGIWTKVWIVPPGADNPQP